MFKFSKDLLYPQNLYCACCGDIMQQNRGHAVCDSCASKIKWIKDNPFESSMEDYAFSDLYACCIYSVYARQILQNYKLKGQTYLAAPIAALMAERFLMSSSPSDFDYICYIPSAKEKLQKRGFNQAKMLAEELSSSLGIPVLEALIKPKDTASMRLSDAITRKNLLIGAFDIEKGASEKLEDSRILLIDDVLTTGSTADEASRTLLSAGAASVSVLVFASSSGNREKQDD